MINPKLVLAILKKEHRNLVKKAQKAKELADEYICAGTGLCDLQKEVLEIMERGEYSKADMSRLKKLEKTEKRLKTLLKMDASEIFEKQFEAEIERDDIAREISDIEFSIEIRGGKR